jgi:SNF2 family DNA or RNA helicase
LTRDYYGDGEVALIHPKSLPSAIRGLLHEGWKVQAEGKLYRSAGKFDIEVTSGIDWFDLNVRADFGGISAPLPRLLAALRKGETLVPLDDGTFGMLPEEWLRKYGGLAAVGKDEGDKMRFSRTQVGLLDALLAAQPEARFDEAFRRTREELHRFSGVAPLDPPATFTGTLRPYQGEALGWFDFLRRFSFGGCLADDMGLGKTVQVLALLEARRESTTSEKTPSLVVVPRSLVFNWKQEASRFAPKLAVLDHSTPLRAKDATAFAGYDVVLTTYGTLRKDAPYLKDVPFDYAILDEAQAIKNPASESAKAVRLIQARHRLALSGTPVQNHLGDLWSLFDFLNPGMLGTVTAFNGSPIKAADEETRRLLSRGLRPFILRRTKEQVARELPPRVEQTLYCELEAEQRKLYDELREHYRQSLLGRIEREGIAKAKIQILEALLRLRQAAIHPGLIDKTRAAESSAKLDLLLPQLAEVTDEGHKALVFSQFTGMLAILKKKLDAAKICYEYLDGKTRDRQERVERFQSDPKCKLFLISLKAGGLGLNLTGADYVFLLDPWWNPAVEAQAIDRTHRIGQTRQVFAFRLIAKGTVEEKVLALQESKRDLADAIINADNSLIRTLGREDLELLLS